MCLRLKKFLENFSAVLGKKCRANSVLHILILLSIFILYYFIYYILFYIISFIKYLLFKIWIDKLFLLKRDLPFNGVAALLSGICFFQFF